MCIYHCTQVFVKMPNRDKIECKCMDACLHFFSSFLNVMADWTWWKIDEVAIYTSLMVSKLSLCCDVYVMIHVELGILVLFLCTAELILEFSVFFGQKYYLFEIIKLIA